MGNCTVAAGDQCTNPIGEIGDLGRGPVVTESVNKAGGKGVARAHCVGNLDCIPWHFYELPADQQRTSFGAAGDADCFPAEFLCVVSAKLL